LQNFVFFLPTRVVFGAGSIDAVGQEAAPWGRRGLLVTGTTFARRSGLIDRLRASLAEAGIAVSLFDKIEPNPRVDTIEAGGRAAREGDADFVLGLGGGSALDAAKGIAVAAVADRPVWEFTRHDALVHPPPVAQALPIVQVPIIASTGSETNSQAVLFDDRARVKAPISSPVLYARVSIVDPTLTFTVPPHYTAVGGMNIVSQLLERYVTSDEFPVTDRIAEGLIRVVMDSLPRAMRRGEDLEARTNLSWTAVVASTVGVAGRSGSTPLLAMAHPLGARFNVEHGRAMSALWPSYMRYALSNRFRLPQIGRFKRVALLGRQIFGVHETDDEVAAEITSHRLVNWLRSMDMPTDLHQLGLQNLDASVVAQLADQAVVVSGNGRQLPGGLTAEDVEHIYEGALR
jgi:alcohol dehydrogenase class IV